MLVDVDPVTCSQTIPLPSLKRKSYLIREESKNYASMVLPEYTDFYTIYIQKNISFVRAAGDTNMYILQAQWHGIQSVLPNDSICHCIVYENIHKKLVLGIYDLIQCEGESMYAKDILCRHTTLHQCFRPNIKNGDIIIHWIGYEAACCETLRNNKRNLPFKASRILRLQNNEYSFVLTPLFIH